MRRAVSILTLLLLILPAFASAQSQATTGVIEGTVADETGGRLPGATVTLTNTGTNFTRDLTTDADGRFRGLLLPLGVYKLTVQLSSFATYVQDGITLAVGQTANVPVTLKVSGVQSEVVVTADSPIVETTRAEKSTLIDTRRSTTCRTTGGTFSASCSSRPAWRSCRGRTATRSASTDRRASPTTSPSTAPISTTPSLASRSGSGRQSAAQCGRTRRSIFSPSTRSDER